MRSVFRSCAARSAFFLAWRAAPFLAWRSAAALASFSASRHLRSSAAPGAPAFYRSAFRCTASARDFSIRRESCSYSSASSASALSLRAADSMYRRAHCVASKTYHYERMRASKFDDAKPNRDGPLWSCLRSPPLRRKVWYFLLAFLIKCNGHHHNRQHNNYTVQY